MPIHHGPLGWIVVGLVAGAIAKWIMPGKDPGGCVVTMLIGIAGALLAGYVALGLGWHVYQNGWRGYVAAIAGAVVLLALYRMIVVRRVR